MPNNSPFGLGSPLLNQLAEMYSKPSLSPLRTQPNSLLGLFSPPANALTGGLFGLGNPPPSQKEPPDLSGQYNTALSPTEEAQFQKWAAANGRTKDSYDYDMRGAWKEIAAGQGRQADNGHFSDKYKKPNHPTFSDQSQYSNSSTPGGRWAQLPDGRTAFYASPTNLKNMTPQQLQQYFQKVEPDAALILGQK